MNSAHRLTPSRPLLCDRRAADRIAVKAAPPSEGRGGRCERFARSGAGAYRSLQPHRRRMPTNWRVNSGSFALRPARSFVDCAPPTLIRSAARSCPCPQPPRSSRHTLDGGLRRVAHVCAARCPFVAMVQSDPRRSPPARTTRPRQRLSQRAVHAEGALRRRKDPGNQVVRYDKHGRKIAAITPHDAPTGSCLSMLRLLNSGFAASSAYAPSVMTTVPSN
jgi:hypothetical protein